MANAETQPQDAAVVDIGSNSVRLVIYRLEGRAMWTVFNEKVLAGLGRGVEQTGRLSPEGVREAESALRRFRAVLDAARPAETWAVATAAVRDAIDGPAFARSVRRITGLEVRVLSGEEEARYAALGVLAGCPEAHGVAGDLGGSSLELVRLDHGVVGAGVTTKLGPFALGAPKDFDADRVRAAVAERLAPIAAAFQAETFHAVGGAWRSLAQIHMAMHRYPLQIVHAYEMPAGDALELARFVSRQSRASLERIKGVTRKRVDTLPWAAMVMEGLVERLGLRRLIVSAHGLREGLLLDALPADVRERDPLVEGCAALGARQGVAEGLGAALADWLRPAFSELPPVFGPERDGVLLEAACRLADVGARLHPDHRADLAFSQVLRAPVPGQTHPERVFLALATYARYGGGDSGPERETVDRILDEARIERARALGLAIRLGADLSGRTASLLKKSRLAFRAGTLLLTADPEVADLLLGEQTNKRAEALARALDLLFQPVRQAA